MGRKRLGFPRVARAAFPAVGQTGLRVEGDSLAALSVMDYDKHHMILPESVFVWVQPLTCV